MNSSELAWLAIPAWFGLSFLSYLWIRAHFHRHGVPEGWRLNEHGASPILGHVSLYAERGGILFRAVHPFPLFWTVYRTPEDGGYSELETVTRSPFWTATAHAREEMETWGEDGGRGLICSFCGEDGFDNSDELETHIEGHPWVAKREDTPGGEA